MIFEDITDESILAELTAPAEPDETIDDTDNVIMPMPSKSDIDNALALLLRHVEGTTGMTEDVLTSLTNIESAVHMCRCKNAKQQSIKNFFS